MLGVWRILYFGFKKFFRVTSSHQLRCGVRYVITLAVGTVIFMICLRGLNYLYVREDEWSRKMFYEYYKEKDNIENLFVGSSHVHWDINPAQLDELNGMNNFNMSISDERLDTAYYLIKEVDGQHDLSHIYLEMYYYLVCEYPGVGNLDNFQNRRNGWRAIDYMKWSGNKLSYMVKIGGVEKGLETWIPFVRYREHLFDMNYIREITERKRSEEYKDRIYYCEYPDGSGSIEYQEKGYVCGTRDIKEAEMKFDRNICFEGDGCIAKSSEEYLRKIIEYCQRRKIGITLITSPIYNLQLLSTENYDDYIECISNIAGEYGIAYYDFNLVKPKFLDIQKKEYFANVDHLTSEGASQYTSCLWRVINNTKEENKELFCQSYQEKLLMETPELYGYYYWNDGGEETRCKVASNRENGMEYRILVFPENARQYMLQDFSINKEFKIPMNEHGVVTIEARMMSDPDETRILEITY